MPVNKLIKDMHDEMIEWRHHLHQFPETAFEEIKTFQFISNKLKEFGLEVHNGLGGTGVVASLKVGDDDKKISLRADIDALNIIEENVFSYKSVNHGKMHACGHDGHTTILLGAAKHLSETKKFSGTVNFIFQPAEEMKAGGKKMIDDGLFELFPTDSIFGLHNMPGIGAGKIAVKSGAIMASQDSFEILVKGVGGHAAMPHLVEDPFIAAGNIITALLSIVSRNINPLDSSVVSVTQVYGGNSWNIIPEIVTIRGTLRTLKSEVRNEILERITQVSKSVCETFGLTSTIVFNPVESGYPVTVNTKLESELVTLVAEEIVGKENIEYNPEPSMGAEDFSFMLEQKAGCYFWIGNGPVDGGCMLHNAHYDFNDDILPVGASFWVALVEEYLK